MGKVITILVLAALGVLMLAFYARQQKPIKSAAIGMGTGILGLGAVKLLSMLIGFTFPLNWFTGFAAVALGVPGVVMTAILNGMLL